MLAGRASENYRLPPSIAQTLEDLVCTDDLSMESARDQRFAFDLAVLAVRDSDAVDLEGAADGALIVGLGFHEISQRAKSRCPAR